MTPVIAGREPSGPTTGSMNRTPTDAETKNAQVAKGQI